MKDSENLDYLRGFVDGHGGEEPHNDFPEGFNDINEVTEKMFELQKLSNSRYEKTTIELDCIYSGDTYPKKQSWVKRIFKNLKNKKEKTK